MAMPPSHKERHEETDPPGPRAALWRWGWVFPVCLAFLGILLGALTTDHRLASRSAAVLLVSCALIVVQELLH